jgi:hypothetical protein
MISLTTWMDSFTGHSEAVPVADIQKEEVRFVPYAEYGGSGLPSPLPGSPGLHATGGQGLIVAPSA